MKKLNNLIIAQSMGAFVDNLFKNALIVLIAFKGLSTAGMGEDLVTQLSAALFIFPFFAFSATAGKLSDSYDKGLLLFRLKWVELVLLLIGSFGILAGSSGIMFTWLALFGLGIQATFLGPIKYSIIPELVSKDDLLQANSRIEATTFLSILIGTLLGSYLALQGNSGLYILSALMIASNLIGMVCVKGLINADRVSSGSPGSIGFNIFKDTYQVMKLSKKDKNIWQSILAISWFWFLGASLLSQFPLIVKQAKLDPYLVTIMLGTFSVGVASGSMLCEKISGKKVEIGLVTVGAFLISLFGIIYSETVAQLMQLHLTEAGLMGLIGNRVVFVSLISLFFLSLSSGIFIVPLYAYIQERSPVAIRSQIIAANNIINALFMVASAGVAIGLIQVLNLERAQYLAVLFGFNLIVAGYVCKQVPEFFFRCIVFLFVNIFYRVKKINAKVIPEQGPVVIVANHVSFLDGLLLFMAIKRTTRFVMWYKIFEIAILKPFMKAVGAIPVASKSESIDVLNQAYDQMTQTLIDEKVLVIFPEGAITKDGRLQEFKPGLLKVLTSLSIEHPVPVITCGIRGMWGSVYSRKDTNGITRLMPKSLFRFRKIEIEFGSCHFLDKKASNTQRVEFLKELQADVSKLT